jgi:hypothetical protein
MRSCCSASGESVGRARRVAQHTQQGSRQQAYTLPLICLKFIVLHIELGLLLTSSNTSSQMGGTRVMLCCSAAPVWASVRSESC